MRQTQPFLQQSGGEVIFMGKGNDYFIESSDEHWDVIFIVKQKSLQHFMEFATNEAYLRGVAHRTVAVEESRLLPITVKKESL